jgi:hypothetical protein
MATAAESAKSGNGANCGRRKPGRGRNLRASRDAAYRELLLVLSGGAELQSGAAPRFVGGKLRADQIVHPRLEVEGEYLLHFALHAPPALESSQEGRHIKSPPPWLSATAVAYTSFCQVFVS